MSKLRLPIVGRVIFIAIVSSLCTATGVLAQSAGTHREEWKSVQNEMAAFLQNTGAPSVSIAVAINGRIVFAQAAGFADRALRIAATPETAYSIASITKPITATAVMRLVERGAIGLDDPANKYLGRSKLRGWKDDADNITVRRLLSHTAGLPEHLDLHYADESDTLTPIETTLSRYGVAAFQPGEIYQYSNLGYGILASIVARQSRRSFDEAMRQEVFSALGMAQSMVRGSKAPVGVAQRYDAHGKLIPDYFMFDVDGASAAYASASDLAKFGLMHLGVNAAGAPRFLSDTSRSLMQKRQTPIDGAAYGLGWELSQERGTSFVMHSGGMPGVRARLTLVPDKNAVIVILVNAEAWPTELYEHLLSIVGVPAALPSGNAIDAAKPVIPTEFAGKWAGKLLTHESTVPFSLIVRPDGNAMAALGEEITSPVDEIAYIDGFLYGFVAGTSPTADARRRPGKVWMQLRLGESSDRAKAPAVVGVIYQGSLSGERDRYTLGAPVRLMLVQ